MRIKKSLLVLCLAAPMAVGLSGCGDKNMLESMSSGSSSTEAKTESALTALDAGNYTKAIDELSALPASDERNKYLAGAYIGAAGFNTLDLITKIDDATVTGTGTDGTKMWNAVSTVFDPNTDGNNAIPKTEIDSKIANLESALSVMLTGTTTGFDSANPDTFKTTLTEERLFQAGTAATLHATLILSSVLPNTLADPTQVPTDPDAFVVPPASFFEAGPGLDALNQIEKDINILKDATFAVGGETGSLVEKMQSFIQDTSGSPVNQNAPVDISSTDMVNFIKNLKGL